MAIEEKTIARSVEAGETSDERSSSTGVFGAKTSMKRLAVWFRPMLSARLPPECTSERGASPDIFGVAMSQISAPIETSHRTATSAALTL